jgi:23S rRNA (adenine2503-C2)-methyltransferase
MKIKKNIEVPTGNILIVEGEKGELELVSLGDYGKNQNIKADFLGLYREIKKIDNTEIMPF